MTGYETLSLLVSLLAAVIAFYSIVRSHSLTKEQLRLQEKQAELAEFQHKLLVREQQTNSRADLRAEIEKAARGSQFHLKNVGSVSAINVRIADKEGNSLPRFFLSDQLKNTFPMTELRPGESVRLAAVLTLDLRPPVSVILTWDDESGNNLQREIVVLN